MKVIIHDIDSKRFSQLYPNIDHNDMQIISDNHSMKACMGCFGCWLKTPGQCVIRDEYGKMGEILSKATEVTIISECYYGGYSPFIKNVLDRSISYLLPTFERIQKATHHRRRYRKGFDLTVCFYKEHLSDNEKQTACELVKANSINFHVVHEKVLFFDTMEQLCREVAVL